MGKFGDFQLICEKVPSYPWCNLFYRKLQHVSNATLTGLSRVASSAPVGVNPECGIPRKGHDGSLGNVATIVVCVLSMLTLLWPILRSIRRREALGRVEFATFLVLYYYSCGLKMLTTGGFFMQGSKGLVVLTALHVGVVVALFGALLVNAFLALRIVDDEERRTLVYFFVFMGLCLFVGIFISYETAEVWTNASQALSEPPERLHSVPLFVITTIWPLVSALGYLVTMLYVVRRVLGEMVPFWYFVGAAILFVASQLVWFLLGKVMCTGSHSKIDSSFLATMLETTSVVMLYRAWVFITED